MLGYKFDYERKMWGGGVIRLSPWYFRASRLYWALKALRKVKGEVLDVGCGAGDFSEAISHFRPDLTIHAVDISKKAIAYAKTRGLKVSFKTADVQNLPYKDNSFDAVVCFDLIEHVKSPSKALKEIRRVLKPGGVFHVFLPTEGNIFTLEGLLIKLGWKAKEIYGGHPHHFTIKQAFTLVKDTGFSVTGFKWGDHLVHQLSEVLHFSFLAIRGRNMDYTVEGYLSENGKGISTSALKGVKNTVASLSFIETMLLCWLPALGLHLTCRKR